MVRLLGDQKQEDRIMFEIHQNLIGKEEKQWWLVRCKCSVCRECLESESLPTLVSSPGGVVGRCNDRYAVSGARRKTRGGVCRGTSKEKKRRRKHSRKDITSYVSVDGGRLKYQRPAVEENTWARRKAIREESFWNPAEQTPLVGRINHDPRE